MYGAMIGSFVHLLFLQDERHKFCRKFPCHCVSVILLLCRFAFVEYDSHRAAAMARRKLMNGRVFLWGHQLAVDWAEPELEVDEEIMAQVQPTIFVPCREDVPSLSQTEVT